MLQGGYLFVHGCAPSKGRTNNNELSEAILENFVKQISRKGDGRDGSFFVDKMLEGLCTSEDGLGVTQAISNSIVMKIPLNNVQLAEA